MIAKDEDRYCFGVKDTMYALTSSGGAIDNLIVWNELPYY